MSLTDALSWLSSHLISPLFSFDLVFWGISFGSIVVAIFGLPLLVKLVKRFF